MDPTTQVGPFSDEPFLILGGVPTLTTADYAATLASAQVPRSWTSLATVPGA